jgi:ATP-dependent protease ClpP protease subunit
MDFLGAGEKVTVKDNHIYFYGGVTTSNCLKLNLAIQDISRRLSLVRVDLGVDNLKIYLHINSFGGSVFAALSSIDTIIHSDYPIVSIIEGAAASAATLISVVCQERVIRENAFMLIHQMSSSFWGKMEEIKDEFSNLKKLTKKLKRIYKNHTKLDNKTSDVKLNHILKRDLWWDSDECMKYGLVDRIGF